MVDITAKLVDRLIKPLGIIEIPQLALADIQGIPRLKGDILLKVARLHLCIGLAFGKNGLRGCIFVPGNLVEKIGQCAGIVKLNHHRALLERRNPRRNILHRRDIPPQGVSILQRKLCIFGQKTQPFHPVFIAGPPLLGGLRCHLRRGFRKGGVVPLPGTEEKDQSALGPLRVCPQVSQVFILPPGSFGEGQVFQFRKAGLDLFQIGPIFCKLIFVDGSGGILGGELPLVYNLDL